MTTFIYFLYYLDYMGCQTDIFSDIGLTKTEYAVYVELLKNNKILASGVIRRLKLHRATVYDVLNRLIEKGLASYIIINKKKYYLAVDPEKLNSIFFEHKKEFENKEKNIKAVVANLSKITKTPQDKDYVAEIYEGREGLKTVMQEILQTGKDFYTIGGEDLLFKDILPHYTKYWAKERERLGIYAKKLLTEKKVSKWKYNIEKQIPKEYGMPSSILIYGTKVVLIVSNNPIILVIIENKNVSKTYLSYFNMLWKLY